MALTMNDAKAIKNLLDLQHAPSEFNGMRATNIRNEATRVLEKIEREAQGRKNIAHMSREERENDGFSDASRRHGERVAARRAANNYAY